MATSPWSPAPAAQPPAAPAYELRPLTLGEILDRIFTIYRSRFILFAGICAGPGLIQLVQSALIVWLQHSMRLRAAQATISAVTVGVASIAGMVAFLVFAVAHAATVYALSELYMNRPVTIADAMRSLRSRWLRFLGIALWQMGSMIWPMMAAMMVVGLLALIPGVRGSGVMAALEIFLLFVGVMGGLVIGYIFYLRNSLAVAAAVVEGAGVRVAMRRSKGLSYGAKGRIFVIYLISTALYMVAGVLQAPLGFVVMGAMMHGKEAVWAQCINLIIGFLGVCVVSPVLAMGLALVYFDQRVRQEALDLELMLGAPEAAAATETATVEEPWMPPSPGRFVTGDAPQHEPTGGVYAPLVSRAPVAPVVVENEASGVGDPAAAPEASAAEAEHGVGPDDARDS